MAHTRQGTRTRKRRDEAEVKAAVLARKYALSPLRERLRGQTRGWLMGRLAQQYGMRVKLPLLYAYLNGYARLPRLMLLAICQIAEMDEGMVLGRVADEALLIQQPRTRGTRTQRRKTASAS